MHDLHATASATVALLLPSTSGFRAALFLLSVVPGKGLERLAGCKTLNIHSGLCVHPNDVKDGLDLKPVLQLTSASLTNVCSTYHRLCIPCRPPRTSKEADGSTLDRQGWSRELAKIREVSLPSAQLTRVVPASEAPAAGPSFTRLTEVEQRSSLVFHAVPSPALFDLTTAKAKVSKVVEDTAPGQFKHFYASPLFDRMVTSCLIYFINNLQLTTLGQVRLILLCLHPFAQFRHATCHNVCAC